MSGICCCFSWFGFISKLKYRIKYLNLKYLQMVFVDPHPAADRFNPAPSKTGCARHDAVVSMLHHLESTYKWETGWDDRHEDTYWDGEMTSFRRIAVLGRVVSFIFVEDQMRSYCYISDGGKLAKNYTATTKEQYDEIMTALEEKGGDCC